MAKNNNEADGDLQQPPTISTAFHASRPQSQSNIETLTRQAFTAGPLEILPVLGPGSSAGPHLTSDVSRAAARTPFEPPFPSSSASFLPLTSEPSSQPSFGSNSFRLSSSNRLSGANVISAKQSAINGLRGNKQQHAQTGNFERDVLDLFQQLKQQHGGAGEAYEMLWCWRYHDFPAELAQQLHQYSEDWGAGFRIWVWDTLTIFNMLRKQSASDSKTFHRLLDEHFEDVAPYEEGVRKRELGLTLKNALIHPCFYCTNNLKQEFED